jgi:hypothetical protein
MYVNFEEIMRDKGALIIYLVGGYGDFTFWKIIFGWPTQKNLTCFQWHPKTTDLQLIQNIQQKKQFRYSLVSEQ